MSNANMERVFNLIEFERDRQDKKWGEQNHSDQDWYLILAEEMGELAKALLPSIAGQEGEPVKELVQVAAVATAWLECVARKESSI